MAAASAVDHPLQRRMATGCQRRLQPPAAMHPRRRIMAVHMQTDDLLQHSITAGHGSGAVVASPTAMQLRRRAWQRRRRGLPCCNAAPPPGMAAASSWPRLLQRSSVAGHAWQRRRRGLACYNAVPPRGMAAASPWSRQLQNAALPPGMVGASSWLRLLQRSSAVGHDNSVPWPRVLPADGVATASSCIACCNSITFGHGSGNVVNGELVVTLELRLTVLHLGAAPPTTSSATVVVGEQERG